jgi:hypothetical protein
MDWIKDPTNRIYVVTIGVLVIILIGAIIYFTSGSKGPAQPGTMGGMGYGGKMAGAGYGGKMGGGAGAGYESDTGYGASGYGATTQQTVVVQNPIEPWRNDPFMPLGYKSQTKSQMKVMPRIYDLPFTKEFTYTKRDTAPIYQVPQPLRRMSGILMNSRVYAIIETNGRSEIVKPGDPLKDGLATVLSIERDKVILKTTGPNPQLIEIRLSAAQRQLGGAAAGAGAGGGMGIGGGMGAGMGGGKFGGAGGGMGGGKFGGAGGGMGGGKFDM